MIPEFKYGEFILKVGTDDLHGWLFGNYMLQKSKRIYLKGLHDANKITDVINEYLDNGLLLRSCCKN